MDPNQMLPSTPMTGPTPASRRLLQQPQTDDTDQQPAGNDYIAPADPHLLHADARQPPFVVQFLRRRLPTDQMGMRRL